MDIVRRRGISQAFDIYVSMNESIFHNIIRFLHADLIRVRLNGEVQLYYSSSSQGTLQKYWGVSIALAGHSTSIACGYGVPALRTFTLSLRRKFNVKLCGR